MTQIHRSQINRVTVMFTYEELIQVALGRLRESSDGLPNVNGAEVELTTNAGKFDTTEDFRIIQDAGGVQVYADPPMKRVAVALEIAQVSP